MPFTMPIDTGSLEEMFLVRLLSRPQRTHATMTLMAPSEAPNCAPSKDSTTLDAVMRPMAAQALPPTYSWNMKAAISVVATHSKFSSREAVAAGVLCSPSSSIMGAATPPARTAPASHAYM